MGSIDKITMAVARMDEMAAFYGQVLNIEFTPVELYGRRLFASRFEPIEFLLCPKDLAGVDADINTIQLRFVIDDVATALQNGLLAGGKLISDVQDLDGRKHASLRDPDGNSLELIQA